MDKLCLSRKETALLIGVSVPTLDAWLRQKNDPIPAVKAGRRWLIPRTELEKWLARQTVRSNAGA